MYAEALASGRPSAMTVRSGVAISPGLFGAAAGAGDRRGDRAGPAVAALARAGRAVLRRVGARGGGALRGRAVRAPLGRLPAGAAAPQRQVLGQVHARS